MKDEIKEILKCLKEEDNYWNKQEHNYAFPDYYSLNREDLHLLLDYITNLQERVDRIDKANCKLRQENEDIKKRLEENTKIYLNKNHYASELEGKYIVEKAKNEKAIEYINISLRDSYENDEYPLTYHDFEHLLNILQGGDKE